MPIKRLKKCWNFFYFCFFLFVKSFYLSRCSSCKSQGSLAFNALVMNEGWIFSPWNSHSYSSLQHVLSTSFWYHFNFIYILNLFLLDWENPIITKMLDRKIQTDKMSVKTSQYGKVLDCFNKSEGVWIFNPTFLESIDSYSNM